MILVQPFLKICFRKTDTICAGFINKTRPHVTMTAGTVVARTKHDKTNLARPIMDRTTALGIVIHHF